MSPFTSTSRKKDRIAFDARLHASRNSAYDGYISKQGQHRFTQLSVGQFGVLYYASLGLSIADTSRMMYLTDETIKSYRKKILRKLAARNITHAVAIAKDMGII